MLEVLAPIAWVVHPLRGLSLAFLSNLLYSPQRQRPLQLLLLLMGLMVLLSVLGAGWLVHPAAGMTLALLAGQLLRGAETEWPTLLISMLLLAAFSVLGAVWATVPLLALGLIWLLNRLSRGALWRAMGVPVLTGSGPSPLSGQAGGAALLWPGVADQMAERLERRRARRVARLSGWLAFAPLVEPTPQLVTAPAGDLLALSRDKRLPEGARSRLETLHLHCAEALTYLEEREQGAAGPGFLVRQIAEDYAPESVRAYLKLPPSLANTAPLQDGKTGRDLLTEQLDLLLEAVNNLLSDAALTGSQHLLAHQRFLKDRFARVAEDLKI